MFDENAIGERFKNYGLAKFGNINNFAKALDIDAANIRIYTRGDRVPGLKILAKLAELDCDIHWLLTGVSYISKPEPAPVIVNTADSDLIKENSELKAQVKLLRELIIDISNKKDDPQSDLKKGVPAWKKLHIPVGTK